MRVRRFEWEGPRATAERIRGWAADTVLPPDTAEIAREVAGGGDAAVLRYTAQYDTEEPPSGLAVDPTRAREALAALEPSVREALELAAANIRAVAEAQVEAGPLNVSLPQGQFVSVASVPVAAAGIYAPGGKAAYPSSVLMCCIPAQVAGVERIAIASPPGRDGRMQPLVLAAAALCDVDEIYAMGGAQAIYALAYGTETIAAVDVVAGPGNAWVRDAKRRISGERGIDSLAGPSELMLVAGADTDPRWAALDLCAQAEHGDGGVLLAVATDERALDALEGAAAAVAAEHTAMAEAPLALLSVATIGEAVDLANAFAPEHLELLDPRAQALAANVTTAGCVFVGPYSATAFGDYVAGSNHVLPTGGAGRFSGPLGPDTFRRKIATVEVPAAAASKLAPHVETIARAEGFPVHGESATVRAEEG